MQKCLLMKQKRRVMLLYEFAIIRFVPKVEREEFVNVGLLLFCKQKRELLGEVYLDENKVSLFSSEVCLEDLKEHLDSFVSIAKALPNSGAIGQMEVSERFRWLAAIKSSCIQVSRPHPGRADDLDDEFKRLFNQLIL